MAAQFVRKCYQAVVAVVAVLCRRNVFEVVKGNGGNVDGKVCDLTKDQDIEAFVKWVDEAGSSRGIDHVGMSFLTIYLNFF